MATVTMDASPFMSLWGLLRQEEEKRKNGAFSWSNHGAHSIIQNQKPANTNEAPTHFTNLWNRATSIAQHIRNNRSEILKNAALSAGIGFSLRLAAGSALTPIGIGLISGATSLIMSAYGHSKGRGFFEKITNIYAGAKTAFNHENRKATLTKAAIAAGVGATFGGIGYAIGDSFVESSTLHAAELPTTNPQIVEIPASWSGEAVDLSQLSGEPTDLSDVEVARALIGNGEPVDLTELAGEDIDLTNIAHEINLAPDQDAEVSLVAVKDGVPSNIDISKTPEPTRSAGSSFLPFASEEHFEGDGHDHSEKCHALPGFEHMCDTSNTETVITESPAQPVEVEVKREIPCDVVRTGSWSLEQENLLKDDSTPADVHNKIASDIYMSADDKDGFLGNSNAECHDEVPVIVQPEVQTTESEGVIVPIPTGIDHTVVKGDTLWDMTAEHYNLSPDDHTDIQKYVDAVAKSMGMTGAAANDLDISQVITFPTELKIPTELSQDWELMQQQTDANLAAMNGVEGQAAANEEQLAEIEEFIPQFIEQQKIEANPACPGQAANLPHLQLCA